MAATVSPSSIASVTALIARTPMRCSMMSSTRHYGDRVADAKLREQLQDWIVDDPWFDKAAPDCRYMHCLPVRRGVAVTDRVLDGKRSVVIHEAQNRMWGQMAVLYQMMGPGV